jgi:regulator of sirC expression with transglutaminase-like and TPR domain
MFGPDQPLDDGMLQPASSAQVLVRMLANLKQNYARLRDLVGLRDVLLLRSALPDVSITEARELARLHHANGDIEVALDVCDQIERAHPQAAALIDGDRRHMIAALN